MSMSDSKNSNSLHGTVIHYSSKESLSAIPCRQDIIDRDAKIVEIVNKSIDSGPIMFMPNSFKEFNSLSTSGGWNLTYKMILYGVLLDGRKTGVILSGIYPYFDIKVPEDVSPLKLTSLMKDIMIQKKWKFQKISQVNAKGFMGHQHGNSAFVRIHFYTLWVRKQVRKYVLEYLHSRIKEIATCDIKHYERVVCRNNEFVFCGWNKIMKYTSYDTDEVCDRMRVFTVNIEDFVEYKGEIKDDLASDRTIVETWDIESYSSTGDFPDPNVDGDVIFSLGRSYHFKDFEESHLDVCIMSCPTNPRPDKLTIVCENEVDLLKACLELTERINPDFTIGFNDGSFDWPYYVTKLNKKGMLLKAKKCLSSFNFYKDKKSHKSEIETNMLKYNFRRQSIKLEAGNDTDSRTLQLPGYINIDACVCLRKIHPKSVKYGLKHFLEMYGLPNKEDMPIHLMFGMYKKYLEIVKKVSELKYNYHNLDKQSKNNPEIWSVLPEQLRKDIIQNKKDMADIAHYCTVDAKSCQRLMVKANVINDGRELSRISGTTMYDALYYADGMKIKNLIIQEGQKKGFLFSPSSQQPVVESGKYTGACVFPPKKGLVAPKLSIKELRTKHETWGALPEKDIAIMYEHIAEFSTQEIIDKLDNPVSCSEDIKFSHAESKRMFKKFLSENMKYPTTGLDYSSLYPSIIMAYNLSPECLIKQDQKELIQKVLSEGKKLHEIDFMFGSHRIHAYTIRHNTTDGKTLIDEKGKNEFGIYPSILLTLYHGRKKIKSKMKVLAQRKEEMEVLRQEHLPEYRKICIMHRYLNSKQKARKVYMNTLYGQMGNSKFCFYMVELAGGTTNMGQKLIKFAKKIITTPGFDHKEGDMREHKEFFNNEPCTVYYGDTDSLYISCPPRHFEKYNRLYYSGKITKEEYCTFLVKTTFTQIELIKNLVNQKLVEFTKTVFLKMAYEEVLFPCIYLMKKMYIGMEHQEKVNFHPKFEQLFVRGLTISKRGVSKISITVISDILMECLKISNIRTIREIIEDRIGKIYERKWKTDNFKKSAVYKPSKDNVTVQTFVRRMTERKDTSCPPPSPNERFEYVVVKKYPFKYNLRGNKTRLLVGDRIEYPKYAEDNGLEMDLDYYVKSTIIGQCAQLMLYDSQFYTARDDESDTGYKRALDKTMVKARKYIESVILRFSPNALCRGPIMKKIYNAARSCYNKAVKEIIPNTPDNMLCQEFDVKTDLYSHICKKIDSKCEKGSSYYASSYVDYMVKKYKKPILYVILKAFSKKNGLLDVRTAYIEDVRSRYEKEYKDNEESFEKLFHEKNSFIKRIVDSLSDSMDVKSIEAMSVNDRHLMEDMKVDISEVKIDNDVESIRERKEVMDNFNEIYNGLFKSSMLLSNTLAIIDQVKFRISEMNGVRGIPPSMNIEEEKKSLRNSLRESLFF